MPLRYLPPWKRLKKSCSLLSAPFGAYTAPSFWRSPRVRPQPCFARGVFRLLQKHFLEAYASCKEFVALVADAPLSAFSLYYLIRSVNGATL